jgi:hypothetical protein
MTNNLPVLSPLQQRLDNYISVNTNVSDDAKNVVNAYNAIATTPTAAETAQCLSDLQAVQSSELGTADYELTSDLVAIVELFDVQQNQLGNSGYNGVEDEVGVTYVSIKEDLIANLGNSNYVDTADNLADTIFNTIEARSPSLTKNDLKAAIDATLSEKSITAPALAALIVSNLNVLSDANLDASGIKGAIFNADTLLDVSEVTILNDINTKEAFLDLTQIKAGLLAAANNGNTDVGGFATALFNVFANMGLTYPNLDLDSFVRQINTSISVDGTGSLSTLKDNIAYKLGEITDLSSSSLTDAVYFTPGGIISVYPRDMRQDVVRQQELLELQDIVDEIKKVAIGIHSDSDAFAVALMDALKDGQIVSFGSLDLDSLKHIASVNADRLGGLSNLLTALNTKVLPLVGSTSLTVADIVSAFFNDDVFKPVGQFDLLDDLEAKQLDLNYGDMRAAIIVAISQADDADGIKSAILDNVGTPTGLDNLTNDVDAAIDATDFSTLKNNLLNNLNAASNNAASIRDAIFANNALISSHLYDLKRDIINAETALDYRLAIIALKAISATTVSGYAQAIYDVITTYGAQQTLTVAALTKDIQAFVYNGGTVSGLQSAINSALDSAPFTAAGIVAAIYANVRLVPSAPTELGQDLGVTENLLKLVAIKNNLVSVMNDSNTNTNALLASSIISAVENSNIFTASLDQSELEEDIVAALANNSIDLAALKGRIKTALTALSDNNLHDYDIQGALYDVNRLASSNKYDLSRDIIDAEAVEYITAVDTSLIDALTPISEGSADIADYTIRDLARAILSGISNGSAVLATNYGVSERNLRSVITHTLSEDDELDIPVFDSDVYVLAANIIANLGTAPKTVDGVMGALFADNALVQDDFSINRDDYGDLVSYINAIHIATPAEFADVRDAIVAQLNLLTLDNTLTADMVATAIVSGIGAASPHLTVNELKADILANAGTNDALITLVGSFKTSLNSIDDNLASASAISDAVYNNNNLPTLANVDAGNLLQDIQTSVNDSNYFANIRDALVTALSASFTGGSAAQNMADAMVAVVDKVTNSVNILSPKLASSQLTPYIAETGVDDAKTAIRTALEGLSEAGLSAAGIKNAIFDNLTQVNNNADKLDMDLTAAVAAQNSIPSIISDVNNFLTDYETGDLSAGIVSAVTDGNTLVASPYLTSTKLSQDVGDADQADLASLMQSNVEAANDVNSLVAAIFDSLTLGTVDADNLETALENYELSREAVFYGNIVTNLQGAGNLGNDSIETRESLASAIIDGVDQNNPTFTNAIVTADIDASGDIADIRSCLYSTLTGKSTAVTIRDVFYNTCLTPSSNNQNGLTTGLTTISEIGLANSEIAARIVANLQVLNGVYTNSSVTVAIASGITPNYGSVSLNLPLADLQADIEFTQYPGFGLTELVNGVAIALNGLIGDSITSFNLKDAIYDRSRVVSRLDNATKFEYDIQDTLDTHNNYGEIKTSLSSVAGAENVDVKNSILAAFTGITPTTDGNALQSDVDSGSGSYSPFSGFVTALNSAVSGADVTDVDTAAKNMRDELYQVLKAAAAVGIEADIKSANDIDNISTVRSVLGDGKFCNDGASHVVYQCSSAGVVGSKIAENTCDATHFVTALSACALLAASASSTFYLSYDGVTCSAGLSGMNAALSCIAGLNYYAG